MSLAKRDSSVVASRTPKSRFTPSARALSLSISLTKQVRKQTGQIRKKAAIVLRKGMTRLELSQVTDRLHANGIGSTPIVIADDRMVDVSKADFSALIVTGAEREATAQESASIQHIVRSSVLRGIPILAVSNAIPMVLNAAGHARADSACVGVLISNTVRQLQSQAEIIQAIDEMAA